jgi:hypothetical protein
MDGVLPERKNKDNPETLTLGDMASKLREKIMN